MSRKHSARSQAWQRVTTVKALWGWYGLWSILRIHLMFSGVLPCLKVIYSPFWSTPVFLLSLFRSEFLLLISFWCIKLLNPFPKTSSVASSLLLYSFAVLVIFVIFARGDRIFALLGVLDYMTFILPDISHFLMYVWIQVPSDCSMFCLRLSNH